MVGGYVRLKKAKFDRNLSLQWTVFVGRAISCEVFLGWRCVAALSITRLLGIQKRLGLGPTPVFGSWIPFRDGVRY